MKRSKAYFCRNALSFRPIHMKPMPKCSLFNSLSSDMVRNVALAKVCALPSARSSCLYGMIRNTYFCSSANAKSPFVPTEYLPAE